MDPYLRISISLTVLTLLAFLGCQNNDTTSQEKFTKNELPSYHQKGSELVKSTQKVLATNLLGAIQDGGPKNAVEFCDIQAIPLTDSMSVELKAHIKRVTDRPRNPNNQANGIELAYIKSAKNRLSNANEAQPLIQSNNGKVTGYYPIITNQLCMQCHGKEGSQIYKPTLTKINALYPEDKATGYGIGDLRGIWVVNIERDSTLSDLSENN